MRYPLIFLLHAQFKLLQLSLFPAIVMRLLAIFAFILQIKDPMLVNPLGNIFVSTIMMLPMIAVCSAWY